MRPCVKLLSPLIIRPHRSTTYVDAAYCYRRSCVVCRSVCQSVTIVSPAKTAEPIEMPFGMWTHMGSRKHGSDRVHIGATWRIRLNRQYAAAHPLLWSPYLIGQTIIFLPCDFFLLVSFFLSSPNLSRRRLDVCHTSTRGVALVRI